MTPPPLLPSFKAKNSSGKPIAFPANVLCDISTLKKTKQNLPNQSKTIVSNSVQAGAAA